MVAYLEQKVVLFLPRVLPVRGVLPFLSRACLREGRAEVNPRRKKRGEALVEDALEKADKQIWSKYAKQRTREANKSDKISYDTRLGSFKPKYALRRSISQLDGS